MRDFGVDDVIKKFRIHIAVNYDGVQRNWAHDIGVTPQYVTRVMTKKRPPSRKMLDSVGLTKVVRYEEKRP